MDLSSPRVKNEEKLAICKKNFFMGLALLPWLWFINGVWFFREAFFKEPFDQQPMIRRYQILSNIIDPSYIIFQICDAINYWGDDLGGRNNSLELYISNEKIGVG